MTKPNIILHIGAEKTGSTSIQKLLYQSPHNLSEKIRFPFPDELPDTFQGRHAGLIKASGCSWYWNNNSCKNVHEKYRKDYFDCIDALAERCKNEGRNHLILSEENLSSRLKYSEIECITNNLNVSFDKKTVVMLIREQFSAYVSQYSTFISSGKSDSLKKFLIDHKRSDYFNYYAIVKNWESCGWNVELALYSSDAINEFLKLITKITCEKINLSTHNFGQNVSLKYPELFFLRYYNKFSFLKKPFFQRFKFAGLKIARNIKYTPKYSRKYSDIQNEISDYYASGNSMLAKRFFNRERLF